ncbi:isopeptide-forming domain-containing fimbrial protein [Gemmata sp. G18]|uniref:Isopeptide-forming domain-containing fimbrial protein n=1 Tax=Gemmata palustris TaxID=2822762 RepID=A0ABS5C1Z5_9BACT|nr:SdrD B-like domain-containing protein [Gemmata palustris]MBP3959943.1 isopeptide-forming domain-containing fimbrial protein [Gemmata palustris]
MFGRHLRGTGANLSPTAPRRRTFQKWRLLCEQLEDRTAPAAAPTATLTGLPAESLIGENLTFTVRFDNTSVTDTGYGPFVDLYLPATGADGAGAAVDDGITFVSAAYLGTTVRATVITLTSAGVPHPFAKSASGQPVTITPPAGFQPGDQLVVLEVPYGSFTPAQPPADIVITAAVSNLADVNVPLPVRAEGGFRFGNDALDNPATDPSLIGAPVASSVTPTLFRLTKTYLGPEDETTTGPNFPRQYRVSVDVATGQTLTALDLTDVLPPELQFVSVVSTSGATTAISTPSTTAPGGTLTRRFASVTGTAATVDAQMTFSYYVPRIDAPLSPIIDPSTGDDTTAVDDASASATWAPIDPRDPTTTVTSDITANDHTLTLKSIATQKTLSVVVDTGAPGLSPGDTVEYTINFQVSDYFAFQNIVLTDLFSDGQLFTGTPTLFVIDGHGAGGNTSGAFGAANFTLTPNVTGGSDRLVLRVSAELAARGFSTNGRLVGGAIPVGGTGIGPPTSDPPLPFGPTQGTITFRTVVQDRYEIDFPSGNPSLDQGDPISNNVTISGDLLNVTDLTPNGNSEDDTSSTSNKTVSGSFVKTVYAINGVLNTSATPRISPGDTVTYRLRYSLPTADVDNLTVTDFLPLPIFDVDTTGAVTGIDNVVSAAVPVAGRAKFGPADTFTARSGIVPTVGPNSSANSVIFNYGTYDDPTNAPATIDILFTVTVSTDPFADQLLLSNGAQVRSNNTVLETVTGDAISQVVLQEPLLNITKGVVATNNPNGTFSPGAVGPVAFNAPGTAGARFTGTISFAGLAATPINSNLRNVDQSDLVTFAVVVENTGSGPNGAFDLLIRDTLPEGFTLPPGGINLRVTDGAGTLVPFDVVSNGSFDELGGIRLRDPSAGRGAIGPGSVNGVTVQDGSNIVVITFDLLTSGNRTNQIITDVATLANYAGSEGGPNFVPGGLTDDATVQIAAPTVTKTLVGTEIADTFNASTEAVIGELVTYRVRITVPEGTTPGAILTDTLDPELAFVGMVSSTLPGGVTLSGGLVPVVTNSGRTVTWTLGNIVNGNSSNAVPEVIELVYTAVVVNNAQSNAGDLVNNGVSLTYQGGPTISAAAPNVTVIEPQVRIAKSVSVDGAGDTGDAGDPFAYTITLQNVPGANQFTADAFDVTFSDLFLAGQVGSPLENLSFTVVDTTGIVTSANFELVPDPGNGNRLVLRTVAGGDFDLLVDAARTITITVVGNVATTVTVGQVIPNDAAVRWTSLNGVPGQRSPFTPDSTERTGAGGVNDYVATDGADINILNPQLFKAVKVTSETATGDPANVVVGEIVRYRVTVAIPEFGTPTSFQFVDLLPAGVQLLSDGSGFVALVSDAGDNLVASNLTDPAPLLPPDLYLTGDENNVTTLTPEFPIPAGLISLATVSGRTQVTFDLGMVGNPPDPSNDFEFVLVEFNALVTNSAGNQAGAVLVNEVSTLVNGVVTGNTASATLRVAEPVIVVEGKSVVSPTDPDQPDTNPHDAGDRVRYRVDYASGVDRFTSAAYDVRLTDTPPAGKMVIDPASIVVFRNGVQLVAGFTNNSTGATADVTLARVDPGDVISVLYEVVLTAGVQSGETITNTANVTWTSLPGNGTLVNPTDSVTPGASGASDGERNGSGGINDYSGSTSAALTIVTPDLDKNILSTGTPLTGSDQFDPTLVDLTVGESVTYRLTITVPEGTSTLNLMDLLPTMFGGTVVFGSARVVAIGGNISGSALAVGAPGVVAGSTVTFNFGTVVNAPDNVTDARDQIVVDVVGRVTDLPENVSGQQVTNTATLNYGFGTISDTAVADIVEPALDIQKSVSPASADAGDVLTYTVTVTHLPQSTAPAFEVAVRDLLNAGNLELIPGTVTASGSSVALVSNGNGTGDTTVTVVALLALGETLTITYQARLTGAPLPGAVVPNTATLDYTSYFQFLGGRAYNDSDPAQVTVNSSSIGGFIYADLNDNGIYEPGAGEALITGSVTMTLTGTDHIGNAVSVQVVTTTGTYSFTGLRPSGPGGYVITQVNQPVNRADGRDTPGTLFGGAGTLGGTPRDADAITGIAIPLGSNAAAANYNFGELPPATVGDFVWHDLNGNGLQDVGEPGLGGLPVTLAGTNPDGSSFSLTTTTSGGGLYSFANLRPGSYTVQFTAPVGYVFTLLNVGADDTIDSDASRTLGRAPVTLAIGETNNTVDAGAYLGAALTGFVYRDFSINGLREPTGAKPETGIAGVTLVLTGTDPLGNPLLPRTATTGALGGYLFDLLPEGTYTVREVQPPSVFDAGQSGFYDGLDTVGTVAGAPRGSSPAKNQLQVALGIGDDGTEYNFGENPPADPFGFVYVDLNDNAVLESGEPGIAGVAVTVSGVAFTGTPLERLLTASDIPGGALTVFTNGAGRWEFPILPPGLYTFVETQPAGYIDGREQNGDPNPPFTVIVGNDRFDNVELDPFPIRGPFNFGELAANSSLAGSVYIDTNNNGVRDPGEMGVPGATVALTGTDLAGRTVLALVVTDGNGNYLFRGMFGGTYVLTETQPPNLMDGLDRAGTLGGIAGNDIITTIPVGLQQRGTNYDFGELGLIDPSKFWLLSSTDLSALFGPPGSGVTDVNPVLAPVPPTAAGTLLPALLVTRAPAGSTAQVYDTGPPPRDSQSTRSPVTVAHCGSRRAT